MSELRERILARQRREREAEEKNRKLRERKKQELEKKRKETKPQVEKAQKFEISAPTLEQIQELTEILKVHLSLLRRKRLIDQEEVEEYIVKYIEGSLEGDQLPHGQTYRSFRVDEFIRKMKERWNIEIEWDLVNQVKNSMIKEGKLLSRGSKRSRRYDLSQNVTDQVEGISLKDQQILIWLNQRTTFRFKEFAIVFYPTSEDPSKYKSSAASSKLTALQERGWITPQIPNRKRESFYVELELVRPLINSFHH